ncbi:serine/threonine-protein kinase polo-like, partial [Diaphorina citri]|uniref:Serine/threonine-protein kinase polo-like n=1 Tax=Diaphorina citri TaxID=121845 RepID=A0A3Q0J7T7_DIACI
VEYKLPATLKKPAATMIKKMLLLDPVQRPPVAQLLHFEFFNDYCPTSLPASCLMTAPRFDSVVPSFNSPRRKPLMERNMEDNNPIIVGEKPGPKILPDLKANIKPGYIRSVKDECQDHLKALYTLLSDTLRNKTSTVPSNAEEMSDPAAQPVIWVSKWVDYSDKYGFGYQLNDDSSGVMFNDLTRMIMLANKNTLCGTPNYIAPEILNKNGHSFEVDVWSIGCIMYTLLVGKPPFETSTLKETYSRIKKVEYKLPATLKKPAATMIKKMLLLDPVQRPPVAQLLHFEFFNDYCPTSLPASCLMTAPRFDSVVPSFNSPRRKPLMERNNVGKRSLSPRLGST